MDSASGKALRAGDRTIFDEVKLDSLGNFGPDRLG